MTTLRIPTLLPLTLALVLPAQSPFADAHQLPDDRAGGGQSVTVEQCKEWLYTLASPEYEGRKTGEPGFLKAAEFISAHFKALGLEARGENGTYYQHVPWSATKVDAEGSYLAFSKDGIEVLRVPANRLNGNVSTSVSATGEVMLLVIAPPERPAAQQGRRRRFAVPKIDGLDDVEVTDKVIVVYVKPGGDRMSSTLTRFAVRQAMAGKNPAAVLFAQDDAVSSGLRGRTGSRRSANPAAAGRGRRPGETTFGGADLESMLAAGGIDAAVLEGDDLTPDLAPLSATFQIVCEEGPAPAMNVWAVLPGSDPQLKDEYVVIGSHLDHVGMRGGLHPGADDDASGTTGVMAVSQMFVRNDIKPKRSILFVCFAGEEDGLVGSRFFARNPPIPLSSMVAELQMDMIGRDEEASRESRTAEERNEKAEDNRDSVHLVGTQKLAPALHELCLRKNETAGFSIEYDQEGMFGRSDHANFARMGVPVAFFFTGLHRDYHETTDTPDKIHFEKLLRVGSYVYDIGFELAQQSTRPEIDPELWKNMRGKGREQPAAPLIGGDK